MAVARLAEHRHIKSLPGKKVGQHRSTLLSRPLGIALYLIIDELVGFRVYVGDCIISLAREIGEILMNIGIIGGICSMNAETQ